MKFFWNWLATSSADPSEVALTVKGYMTSIVPVLMFVIHNPSLSDLPNDVYALVLGVFAVYSAVAVVVGIVRKLYNTFKPQAAQN